MTRQQCRQSFMVRDGPSAWSLTIDTETATVRPHWSWILGTFGFAWFRRAITFHPTSSKIVMNSWKRRVVFTVISNEGKKRFEFVDATATHHADIQAALRAAGFVVE